MRRPACRRRKARQSPGMGGAPATVEEIYADFRDCLDGVKVPFKITIMQNGQQFAEMTVHEFKINTGLKPEDLSKKP